jgi:CBS domain-containing protein
MSHALIYPTESVGKIMRTPVMTIRPDDSLRRAAQLMEEKNIGSVVVVEDSRPKSILTERDFVRLMAKGENSNTEVRNAMTTPVISCESDKKVTEAFVMMVVNKIDHLPTTKEGKFAGIVVARDLLTATLV